MAFDPELEQHQAFADGIATVLHERIAEATPIEVLSARGGKLLQVMETPTGERFTTRSFTYEGVTNVVAGRGIEFREAWGAMYDLFEGAGISVLPSTLIESTGDYSYIAVGEFIEPAASVSAASTHEKAELAKKLGGLLRPNLNGYTVAPEMVNDGMFVARPQEDGSHDITLVDLDPHIIGAGQLHDDGLVQTWMLTKLMGMFWDAWSSEDERVDVARSLFAGVADLFDDVDIMSPTGIALQDIHMMTNGVDFRSMHR